MIQMPGMNTPQFGWVKSRLPKKAQPVPPIYQPEIAADAIVFASMHDRREIYVGMSTVKAVVGNKILPGLLDHYLGKTGFGVSRRRRTRIRIARTTCSNRSPAITARMAVLTPDRRP